MNTIIVAVITLGFLYTRKKCIQTQRAIEDYERILDGEFGKRKNRYAKIDLEV